MIASLTSALKPLFVPLLRLKLSPPHLPEGQTLVRTFKPAEAWLTLRYLQILLGLSTKYFGGGVLIVMLAAYHSRAAIFGAVALLSYLLAFTGFVLVWGRVDYELRHYLVGDKSLRVTHGALVQREDTLSYANVQDVTVSQGPIERLFGLSSLTVSTAGGASKRPDGLPGPGIVTLEGLTDAADLRNLVLKMMREQKGSGLGEHEAEPAVTGLKALEEVRDAALMLRNAATRRAVSVDFQGPRHD